MQRDLQETCSGDDARRSCTCYNSAAKSTGEFPGALEVQEQIKRIEPDQKNRTRSKEQKQIRKQNRSEEQKQIRTIEIDQENKTGSMNKINYSKELDQIIERLEKEARVGENAPTLLLQACCAPCSSACLERLREDFKVTVYYYNPNISEEPEYEKRKAEEKRLIEAYNEQVEKQNFEGMQSSAKAHKIEILDCDYDGEAYEEVVKGFEACPEGGDRCTRCFHLRLSKTAEAAKEHGFDYFSTTLTISPLKNADKLNRIGLEMSEKYDVPFLPSDFKKKNGYKRSIELSNQFELYRQNYCGCKYSKGEAFRAQNVTD